MKKRMLYFWKGTELKAAMAFDTKAELVVVAKALKPLEGYTLTVGEIDV